MAPFLGIRRAKPLVSQKEFASQISKHIIATNRRISTLQSSTKMNQRHRYGIAILAIIGFIALYVLLVFIVSSLIRKRAQRESREQDLESTYVWKEEICESAFQYSTHTVPPPYQTYDQLPSPYQDHAPLMLDTIDNSLSSEKGTQYPIAGKSIGSTGV